LCFTIAVVFSAFPGVFIVKHRPAGHLDPMSFELRLLRLDRLILAGFLHRGLPARRDFEDHRLAVGMTARSRSVQRKRQLPCTLRQLVDGNCVRPSGVIYFRKRVLDPLHAALVARLQQDRATATADIDILATLASLIYYQMDLYPPSLDLAIVLACQHLADIRSELIEAGFRAADR